MTPDDQPCTCLLRANGLHRRDCHLRDRSALRFKGHELLSSYAARRQGHETLATDRDTVREQVADEFYRHASTMTRDRDDDRVTLGCICGHQRGDVTAAELAADLDGYLRAHRLHLADAVMAAVIDPLHERLRRVEKLANELAGWPAARIMSPHDSAERLRRALDGDR